MTKFPVVLFAVLFSLVIFASCNDGMENNEQGQQESNDNIYPARPHNPEIRFILPGWIPWKPINLPRPATEATTTATTDTTTATTTMTTTT